MTLTAAAPEVQEHIDATNARIGQLEETAVQYYRYTAGCTIPHSVVGLGMIKQPRCQRWISMLLLPVQLCTSRLLSQLRWMGELVPATVTVSE